MSNNFELSVEKLVELGVPQEMAEKIKETAGPSINTSATGGKGGTAVSLTYVDNYSTLLLVYTFLLTRLDHDRRKQSSYQLNNALLQTLETAMKEQKQYRKAFLNTVKELNQPPNA
ncbi:hypothetical protein [Bacillus sp. T33-2]|uniref:hypothetical protein n=1 Tax=Bacillus sp. T33-2 TaxID=2054168 RepID=UPI0021551BBC|nr:hypothetical protein [Bacillus sp. T33-2]